MLAFILARIKEPSSWRGLIAIAAAFGVTVSPEMQEAILSLGLGIFGLIEVLRKEKK